METESTKTIKSLCHTYAPKLGKPLQNILLCAKIQINERKYICKKKEEKNT